jgi:hypothetical protein
MFAPAFRRRWGRGRAAWRSIVFRPSLATANSTIKSAGRRSLGSTSLARPALASLSFALSLGRRRFNGDRRRRVEIDVGRLGEFCAQLVAQHAGAHLDDLAFRQVAEFERTEGHADQPVDCEAQVLEDFLDLAVFSFPEAQGEPSVRALHAVELGLDPHIVDAIDGDAFGELVERRLVDRPMRAHPIASQPASRRQLQHARQPAVVGEQQEPFGVDVEPADCDHARQVGRQHSKNRVSPLWIARGGDETPRLVEQKEAGALRRAKRGAVDAHVVRFADVEGWAREDLAIDADTPLGDPRLGFPAGTDAGPRHDLGDALARANF